MSLSQAHGADTQTYTGLGERHDEEVEGTKTSSISTNGEDPSSPSTSFLRLDQVHWGFWQSGKANTPEPQSTQVEVLGEVSIPYPSNCEHQSSQDEPDQRDKGREEADTEEATGTEKSEHETSQSLVSTPSLTEAPSISTTDPPESHVLEDQIANLGIFSPALTARKEAPRIKITTPSVSNTSLGTRVLNSASSTPAKEMKFSFMGRGSGEPPPPVIDSASPGAVPDQLGENVSGTVPAGGLPEPPVPMQFTVPAAPSVVSVPGAGGNRPHARKKVRDKLKQKSKPKLVKVRKLVLRKKVLSVILGKELSSILEPHLSGTTSNAEGLTQGGPSVPTSTPL